MSLAWPTGDCPLETHAGESALFSLSFLSACVCVCVCVSLSLARRGGKTLDVPDEGKQQVEEL